MELDSVDLERRAKRRYSMMFLLSLKPCDAKPATFPKTTTAKQSRRNYVAASLRLLKKQIQKNACKCLGKISVVFVESGTASQSFYTQQVQHLPVEPANQNLPKISPLTNDQDICRWAQIVEDQECMIFDEDICSSPLPMQCDDVEDVSHCVDTRKLMTTKYCAKEVMKCILPMISPMFEVHQDNLRHCWRYHSKAGCCNPVFDPCGLRHYDPICPRCHGAMTEVGEHRNIRSVPSVAYCVAWSHTSCNLQLLVMLHSDHMKKMFIKIRQADQCLDEQIQLIW